MTDADDGDPLDAVQASVRTTLTRIDELDPSIGAFVDVFTDRAIEDVERLRDRPIGPLHGIPIGVKELFDVAGGDNSYGSMVRAGVRSPADAAIVQQLRLAGAVIVGLTRSHEFGWGITTQHETRGSTRNPWHLGRVPGGSSGGSAAAVAAGLVPLAVGSDTGGSIRIPAAFCGVLGLKTTPGRISRRGGVALAPTFDTPGFLARSVGLLTAALAATAGTDVGDPVTLGAPSLHGETHARPFRFDAPDELQPSSLSACRTRALEGMVAALEEIGGSRVDVHPPDAQDLFDVFVPLQMAEALYVHSRLLGTWPSQSDRYGADVRGRLEAAGSVTLGDYLDSLLAARAARSQFLAIFERTDVLVNVIGATGPSTTVDPDTVTLDGRLTPLRNAVMPSTVPQNVAGLPSLTLPAGFDEDGLPIGVQLCGAPWSEPLLLRLGRQLEEIGAFIIDTPQLLPPA